jgi:hypothetical protein
VTAQRSVRVFEIGQRLFDRYEIFARYSGGMATVYGALDVADGSRYAIKTCRAHANQAALDEAFRREVRIGLELEPHPGVLRLLFAEALGDQLFAFFDFLEGGEAGRTLRDHMDAGAVTTSLLGDHALQIARALEFLGGKRSIAHLDLKPSNILVDASGRIQISDFGLSSSVEMFQTHAAKAAGGTAGYMAPEQVERSFVDERADIYAFAVILHEMVTGRAPDVEAKSLYWHGLSRDALQEPFRRELTELQASNLWRLIGACIDPDAADRYPNFGAMVRALIVVFGDRPPPPLAAEPVTAMLRRARSWQVLGEHSQSLRALNRLLLAHPDCVEAFEAAKAAYAALAAEPARRPPPTRRADPTAAMAPVPYRELAKFAEQCSREYRDATALRHVLAALAAAPRDKALLELAAVVAHSGMSVGRHHLAAARGENVDDALILDPLLDPIFCQCTYRAAQQTDDAGQASRPGIDDRCRRFWVPLGILAAGARNLRVLNMAGGRCPKCHNVFCREHFAHAQLGVDSSRPLCPYDRTPLEPVIHPNGRGAQRIARASHPVRLVRVLREGPLPPDAPYIAAAIEALAPGSLDAEPAIEGRAVTEWSYAESRNDGLQLAYRPPRFEVATTHAVFEGDRICIARVLELRPGSDGDVHFPGDEPSGEPAALETATRDIGRLFAAHVERLRSLSRDDLSLLAAVARCEPLLDARLLGPTARAALRCLQQSERTRQAMSSGALIGARAILVTAIAEADPDRARSWFPVSYSDTLRELLETTLRVPRGFDIAHWIYCRRGNDCTVQLGFSPHDGGVENVAIVVPSDLLSESELRSLDD